MKSSSSGLGALGVLAVFSLSCGGSGSEPETTFTDPTGDHYLPYDGDMPTSDGMAAFDLVGAVVHLDESGMITADLELAANVLTTYTDLAGYYMLVTGPNGSGTPPPYAGGIYALAWESEFGTFECHTLMWNGGGFQVVDLPAGATCTVNGTHLLLAFPVDATGADAGDLGLTLFTEEFRGVDYYVDDMDPIEPIPGA